MNLQGFAFWGCEPPEITRISDCYISEHPSPIYTTRHSQRCKQIVFEYTFFYFSGGLQNLHFDCVKRENQRLYLNLEWKHVLKSDPVYSANSTLNRHHGSYYEVAVTDSNTTTFCTKAISHYDEIPDGVLHSHPQNFLLPVAYGISYRITITPIYLILKDTRQFLMTPAVNDRRLPLIWKSHPKHK